MRLNLDKGEQFLIFGIVEARKEKNKIYRGADNKESLYDITMPVNWNNKCVIFIHGYMGYKDWGAWNLVEDYFVNNQFAFVKYNVSHNGGTTTNPIDFPDLESFGKNTYSKEVADFDAILNLARKEFHAETKYYVIGHSRGGGIAALQSKNEDLTKIALLAPISDIGSRFPKDEALEEWKSKGVYYRKNGRTNQEMPHLFLQYEDFIKNKERLDIEDHCKNAIVPLLIIHGENDTSVLPKEGQKIAEWSGSPIEIIENTAHTFDSKQPWTEKKLPLPLENACKSILTFFNDER